jgi:hypothetical protein
VYTFDFICHNISNINQNVICNPLPEDIAKDIFLNGTCHVDHEGFDLNEIEQALYTHNDVQLIKDTTWYKDGGQIAGTNAIIYNWVEQSNFTNTNLILDHSQFVVKYPIVGAAREQLLQYTIDRPELLRLLSIGFKCGLDLCIDCYNGDRVEPILHIEWDFDNYDDVVKCAHLVTTTLQSLDWTTIVPVILRFNAISRKNKIDAFSQADTRAMIIFGERSYKLIPSI